MTAYPIEVLEAKNPDYEIVDYNFRALLYLGGTEIIKPAQAAIYIPRISEHEHEESYRQKLNCATYTNNFAKAVNFYMAQLFTKKLTVLPKDASKQQPFYEEFSKDADRKGTTFRQFLQGVMTDLLTHAEAIVAQDLPTSKEEVISLHHEEEMGKGRAYLMRIPHGALIDWDLAEDGTYKWVRLRKTFQVSKGPFIKRTKWTTQYKTVERIEDGTIKWQLFQVEHENQTPPERGVEVPLIDEGVYSNKQFPIIRHTIPDALWLGNKIAGICADHFRIKTGLHFSQMRVLFAMLVYKMGAASEDASPVNDNDNRHNDAAAKALSRGMVLIGENDGLDYVEPSGSSYQLINQQLREEQDDVMRIADQMAQSIAATEHGSARSAASKMQDNHSTQIILEELGSVARQITLRIYNLVSDGRKEEVEWEVSGMCDYKIVDRKDLLEEALTLSNVTTSLLSPLAQTKYNEQVTIALLKDLSPEDEQTIRKEIEDSVKNGGAAMAHPKDENEDEGKKMNEQEGDERASDSRSKK